jgi:hypothetical protein
MESNPNDVNIIFNNILKELSDPIIEFDDLNHIFQFITNDLKPLYENNETIQLSIKYFNDMINELNTINSSQDQEKLFLLTLIVDKYLCVTENNKSYIESQYTIIQYMMQACFNQVLQQLYRIVNKRNMDINDIDDALNLFKETFNDIMHKIKGYQMSEKKIDV